MLDYTRNAQYCYHLILQSTLPSSYNYTGFYVNAVWVSSIYIERHRAPTQLPHGHGQTQSEPTWAQFPESPQCSFYLCPLLPSYGLTDASVQKTLWNVGSLPDEGSSGNRTEGPLLHAYSLVRKICIKLEIKSERSS